jgi:cytochrome P450
MIADKQDVNHLPPTPDEGLFGGHVFYYHGNPLPFLVRNMQQFGAISHFRLFKYHFFQVNDPELVGQVLVKQASKFHKSVIYKKVLSEYLGNGLLISDGDFWKRQRKLAQPAFHTQRIQAYADIMVDNTLALRNQWQAGQVVDVAHDMMQLTLFIVAKTLFDTDVHQEVDRVGDAMNVMLHSVIDKTRRIIRLPEWIPTPQRFRKQQSIDTLHTIIMDIINQRRQSGEDRGDLLSMFLMAEDEDGNQMTDAQVKDEALTMFLAGHETTANALAWTFYLLSQHPKIDTRVYQEIRDVLGDRAPTLADLKDLPYTLMVLKEAMRLYPPAWGMGRAAIEDVQIGGYTLPEKWGVMVIPYAIHRNPAIWENPEDFNPERFSSENEKHIPKHAYLPFGGGPRICIGNSFAMMEAHLVLATLLQRYQLELVQAHVEPEPLVTLRPKGGLKMRVITRG